MRCLQKDLLSVHCLYFSVLSLNYFQIFAINQELLQLPQPSQCKSNEYFDAVSFSCAKCQVNKNLEPSSDQLQCVCNKHSKLIGFQNGQPLCTFCGPGATVTRDGQKCIPCKDSACQCSSDQILIQRNFNGSMLDTAYCVTCSGNTYPSADGSKCVPCDGFIYNNHAHCECPSATHMRLQKYCILKETVNTWQSIENIYLIKFENQLVESYYFRIELHAAIQLCKNNNTLACEHLSSMCALTLYTNDVVCQQFKRAEASPIWLFYSKHEATAALYGKQIIQRYSLLENNDRNVLNFTVAAFSLNGSLQSIGKPNLPCNFLRHVKFGINWRDTCKLTVDQLLRMDMKFFYPYLSFVANGKRFTHALPVLIKNINKHTEDISDWQFVRKLFLLDNISGIEARLDNTSNTYKSDNSLSVLRYMKSLRVLVNVRSGENSGKIFPPLLIVEYAELTNEEMSTIGYVTIECRVTFISKDNNIYFHFQVIVGILSFLALIVSGLKTWNYCSRNYIYIPRAIILLWFSIYTMSIIGNIVILSIVGMCIYLFVFYNGQTVPYIFLPDDFNDNSIQIWTVIGFCFKLTEVISFVYQYWNIRIFFIDWEKPKTAQTQFLYDSPRTTLWKLYSSRFTENKCTFFDTPSEIISDKRKKARYAGDKADDARRSFKSTRNDEDATKLSALSSETNSSSPSIWRTYFLANQWLRLETRRKTSIIFQSVATLFILEIITTHLSPLTKPGLTIIQSQGETMNLILYYGISAITYIVIYFTQFLAQALFWEQCTNKSMGNFLHLCSISNISIFILPFMYHGFYIHGRSVHGFGDMDLPTLMKNLKREDDNLCAHRGLVPGMNEQVFIMSLTETFKALLDKFLSQQHKGSYHFLKTHHSPNNGDALMFESQHETKQFLSQFIEHCSPNEDYVVKEQHLFERLCDILFLRAKEKSVFYTDVNQSIHQVLLHGNEWMLASFEIAIFFSTIVLSKSYVLASAVTILLSTLLGAVIKHNRKRDMKNKSSLDGKFLW